MDAYYKALEIKPNYVRVWVNLGIAHAYKVLIIYFKIWKRIISN